MSVNLKEKVDDLDIRTGSLESVLGQFISSMNLVMSDMHRDTENFRRESLAGDERLRRESLAGDERLGKKLEEISAKMKEDTENFRKESLAGDERLRRESLAGDERLRKKMEEISEKMEEDTENFRKESLAGDERLRRESLAGDERLRKKMEENTENFRKESMALDERLGKRIEEISAEMKEDTENFKKEVSAKIEEVSAKIEEVSAKMEKKMEKETGALKKKLGQETEKLSKKMGTLVEDMVAPNIPGIAGSYFDDPEFEFFAVRARKRKTDRSAQREFDVIAVSERNFYISETKSKPRPEDVRDFLDALGELEDYFPEIRDRRVIPIFSTLYLPENIHRHLTRNRIYAMGLKEGTMDLLNFEEVESQTSGRT
ncbi:hypothetical protein QUF80_00910 [Desulfococcaceae bacterium HSG8]|nr:hypothetical protein [Desulfococcaceae bacterium HSG8]